MKKEIKKILKVVAAVKIIGVCATVAMKVYELIPKYDKIEGINEKALIEQIEEY